MIEDELLVTNLLRFELSLCGRQVSSLRLHELIHHQVVED